ncbi:MAG: histidinol-phosphatase, partial [Lewinella sp.]|nr:histidinol-phosphatase [Lewinella sp.]
MQKILFLDRDGTINLEPDDYQVDALEKVEFYPGVFRYLGHIVRELDFELVMVTNQDGLGTDSFPEDTFWPSQHFILRALANEGITFTDIVIDRTFARENKPTRKPGTALLTKYLGGDYDLANSFVVGDRLTDMQLARNLGARGIWLNNAPELGANELDDDQKRLLDETIALTTTDWADIYALLKLGARKAHIRRTTKETDIEVDLDLDGSGRGEMETGL